MQMKKDTDLALRILLSLARCFPRSRSIVELARSSRIPRNHVQRIIGNLCEYGLAVRVQKTRVEERFCLATSPEDIDLYDIAASAGDEVNLSAVFNRNVAHYSSYGKILSDLSGSIQMQLRAISLKDMMEEEEPVEQITQ